MNTNNMRLKLHKFVDNGDENLLKLMFAVAKEYSNINDEFEFSKEDIAEFDRRRNARLTGESKTYSWEDAKSIITGKKSA